MFDYSSCSASPTETLIWTWLEGLVRPYEHLRSFRKASKCLLKAHEETISRYPPSSFTSPWSSQLSYRSSLSDNPGLSGKPTTLISLGIQQGTLIHEAILMWWPGFLCFPVVPKKKRVCRCKPTYASETTVGISCAWPHAMPLLPSSVWPNMNDHRLPGPGIMFHTLSRQSWCTCHAGRIRPTAADCIVASPLSHSSHFGGF